MAANVSLLPNLSTPHQFLQPSSTLHLQTLSSVKSLLDPLAANVADGQKLRRDENRRKRKRKVLEHEDPVLQLRQVHTTGLAVKQVWEQARRILDAALDEVERDIAAQSINTEPELANGAGAHSDEDDDLSTSFSEEEGHDSVEDHIPDDGSMEEEVEDEDGDGDEEEDVEEATDDEDRIEADELSSAPEPADPGTYTRDPNHLNDGFFSIDSFNKQTQFMEQQDVRGEDDNPSDEDDIDWDADPLALSYHKSNAQPTAQSNRDEDKDDESEDEDDGPTFGNADLNADGSDEEMTDGEDDDPDQGLAGLDNTNDIRYADFFAPPPKKPSRTKRMRALPKTQPIVPSPAQTNHEVDNDMSRAIADVRRDLLESDDGEVSDGEHSASDLDRPSTKNLSTHEKQQLHIAAEIRRLEAASVTKRDWTLSGEARGVERPLNSLLEEDLEFERVGKPVPVITAEVSEEIEELIKRRIIAREFDEIVRRHPDSTSNSNTTRRGRIELDDSKPTSGLGEIYEQEHLKSTDPGYVDKRSAATKKAHDEISKLWKDVSVQLDLLSNLNFKPRRVQAEIKTVEDKPTISMEDARPSGAGEEESMLAPQEVYRPGDTRRKDDGNLVVRKGGASVAKDEMTREEKLRRRRRDKERTKKGNSMQGTSSDVASANHHTAGAQTGKKHKKAEKEDILAQLRKGNVKVIGKKGDLQELGGKRRNKQNGAGSGREIGSAVSTGAGNLKL